MPVSAFIIRPFGKKDITINVKELPAASADAAAPAQPRAASAQLVEIDFDAIHTNLIAPALRQLGIAANTTEIVVSSGNIREDMFHLLMTADLVLADVSVHNPNVFYELGIRHAFRDKFTFLIRSKMLDDVPFDLKTDRYFGYDHTKIMGAAADAQVSVDALARAIRATLNSERSDSPVFKLLPRMRSEDRSRFISVPRDFKEDLDRAKKNRRAGDLRLLASECEGFLWEVEGLREVGRAQFELNYMGGACSTFEQIVRRYPDDVEANMVLSTVYQRRDDGPRSEQALARVARQQVGDVNTAAEIQSLVGRNLRARWYKNWAVKSEVPAEAEAMEEQQKRALSSPFLRRAHEAYASSFRGNLNYVYAGLNALSLLLTEISLGEKFPGQWKVLTNGFEDMQLRKREAVHLTQVLAYALECEHQRLERERRIDYWFYSQKATFMLLTCNEPLKVEQAYRVAMAYAPRRTEESMRSGLELYKRLSVRHFDASIDIQANIDGALKLLSADRKKQPSEARLVLLFAGLRVETKPLAKATQMPEAPAKKMRRYLPATAEDWARQKIEECVADELSKLAARQGKSPGNGEAKSPNVQAMATGGCGADLLFHEICQERGIPAQMYLALPKDQYIGRYVVEAGPAWVERFNRAYASAQLRGTTCDLNLEQDLAPPVQVLSDTEELPRWLQSEEGYSIGRRTEVWMLQHALVQRGLDGPDTEVTLIVMWAPSMAGPGGLQHLVELAERSGVKVVTIDCGEVYPEKQTVVPGDAPALGKAAATGAAG